MNQDVHKIFPFQSHVKRKVKTLKDFYPCDKKKNIYIRINLQRDYLDYVSNAS